MDMERIYKTLSSDKTYSTRKKGTNEITEKDIFDEKEDDLGMANTENTYNSTDEDIFGEDTEYIQLMCRNSELEKENTALKNQNLELQKEIEILKANIQKGGLCIQEKKKNKPSAYRDDIDLEKLVTLYKKHLPMNKIGLELGCNPHTVKSRLEELGIL